MPIVGSSEYERQTLDGEPAFHTRREEIPHVVREARSTNVEIAREDVIDATTVHVAPWGALRRSRAPPADARPRERG
jgi:hypothetical protein